MTPAIQFPAYPVICSAPKRPAPPIHHNPDDTMPESAIKEVHELRAVIDRQNLWLRWMLGGIGALLAGAFTIGFWVANQEAKLNEIERAATKHALSIDSLEKDAIASKSSRFTAADWFTANSRLMDLIHAQEKRVQANEQNIDSITKALDRIEQKLGTRP